MVFDSASVSKLLKRYANKPDCASPYAVLLARRSDCTVERQWLEAQVAKAPEHKRVDWINRLTSEKYDAYLGALFEIQLWHWLQPLGSVDVEPDIQGDRPDFMLKIGNEDVAIECKAVLISPGERQQRQWESCVNEALCSIRRPYVISIEMLELKVALPNVGDFQVKVEEWLDSQSGNTFHYYPVDGIKIVLKRLHRDAKYEHLAILGPARSRWVNPSLLHRPLRKKAAQHSSIRKAGIPYVLALFLEPWQFTHEAVAEAWFGGERWMLDKEANLVIGSQHDGTGIHFLGVDEVRHTSVSGTLVFRPAGLIRGLCDPPTCWYIENPFASAPLRVDLFPVKALYVAVNRTAEGIQMQWQRGKAS